MQRRMYQKPIPSPRRWISLWRDCINTLKWARQTWMTPGNTTTWLAACWAGWMALVKMMKTIWNFKRGDKPTFYLPFCSDLFLLFTHSCFLFFLYIFSESDAWVAAQRADSGDDF